MNNVTYFKLNNYSYKNYLNNKIRIHNNFPVQLYALISKTKKI